MNATIASSQAAMNTESQVFEPIIYEGAGHGFFRAGEEEHASEANKKARNEGLARLKKILSSL